MEYVLHLGWKHYEVCAHKFLGYYNNVARLGETDPTRDHYQIWKWWREIDRRPEMTLLDQNYADLNLMIQNDLTLSNLNYVVNYVSLPKAEPNFNFLIFNSFYLL